MRSRPTALLLLALAATLTSCASFSPKPTPPIGPPLLPPAAPAPPSVETPPPEGTYWQMHCEFRQSLQRRLSVTLPPFEPCSRHGQEPPRRDDDRR